MAIGNKQVIISVCVLSIVLVVSLFPDAGNVITTYSAEQAVTGTPPGVYLPVIVHTDPQQGTPVSPPDYPAAGAGWLEFLNFYRATAGLIPLANNSGWGEGGWLHSRYMVKNDYVDHSEDPENAWYTVEGDAAAKSSNLVATSNIYASDAQAIELWMQAPFHALGIIDPELHEVGFGSFREEDGGLQMGASLDVIRGLKALPATTTYPIAWPGDGMNIPLTSHLTEYPDPLSSCPGYQRPSGLPIILQIGPGDKKPVVSSYSFKRGAQVLEACLFDETSYQNPDANSRDLGRAVLDARDAIVLIPRQPLEPGATYTASITVNGMKYTWSFSVLATASQTALQDVPMLESQGIIIR